MTSHSVEVYASADDLPAGARVLLDAAESGSSIYEGTDWYRLFQGGVPSGRDASDEFWLLNRDGRVRLVLPLRRFGSKGLHGRRLTALANYYTGLYAPAHDGASARDWATLLRAAVDGHLAGQRPADRLTLEPLPGPGPTLDSLRAGLSGAGLSWREEVAFGNWHEPVLADFSAYWSARPGALRNTADRAARRFGRAGGTLEVVDGRDPETLATALAAYEAVYRSSWKPQEPYSGFIPALANLAAKRGWLRLGVARLAGQPVAAHLWLVHAGKAEIYKLAYVESAASWSVGTLLGRCLAEHVIVQDRVQELDYVSGDDPYKRQWMTRRRERLRLDALNPRTPRGLLAMLHRRLRG